MCSSTLGGLLVEYANSLAICCDPLVACWCLQRGQKYEPHHDYFSHPKRDENGGNRMATVLVRVLHGGPLPTGWSVVHCGALWCNVVHCGALPCKKDCQSYGKHVGSVFQQVAAATPHSSQRYHCVPCKSSQRLALKPTQPPTFGSVKACTVASR